MAAALQSPRSARLRPALAAAVAALAIALGLLGWRFERSASAASAPSPRPAGDPDDLAETGSLEEGLRSARHAWLAVRVVDGQSHAPVQGARALGDEAGNKPLGSSDFAGVLLLPPESASSSGDASDVADVIWRVEAEGYATTWISSSVLRAAAEPPLTLELQPAAALAVTVNDDLGAPQSDVTVSLSAHWSDVAPLRAPHANAPASPAGEADETSTNARPSPPSDLCEWTLATNSVGRAVFRNVPSGVNLRVQLRRPDGAPVEVARALRLGAGQVGEHAFELAAEVAAEEATESMPGAAIGD